MQPRNHGTQIKIKNPSKEVYQLAADMGGMGFIHSAECEIMHNSALINIHMPHAAATMGVARCGAEEQRSMGAEVNLLCTPAPVLPCSEGWEKLYAERVAMAYGRR